jgi:hypothetical protein
MAERRRLERFDLCAPAQVVVEYDSGERTNLSLKTKDISSAGAYLFCPQPPAEGARVKMELLLSLDALRKVAGEKGRARIKVRGRIIRVDPDGIAIRFENKYKITALENGNREVGFF